MGRIEFAALSDQGRIRQKNEDRWYADPEQGLFIVSDGMGGQLAGEVAAEMVVNILPHLVKERLSDFSELTTPLAARHLSSALIDLSDRVRENAASRPELVGMGATAVTSLIRKEYALISHMGDSRAYLFRDEALIPLTRDHSILQILLDSGQIKPEDAPKHPARGRVTRAIGMEGRAVPETSLHHLENGDRLLLCCDGLTDMISDKTISLLLQNYIEPETACRKLVDSANSAGGKDNITVVLVHWWEH